MGYRCYRVGGVGRLTVLSVCLFMQDFMKTVVFPVKISPATSELFTPQKAYNSIAKFFWYFLLHWTLTYLRHLFVWFTYFKPTLGATCKSYMNWMIVTVCNSAIITRRECSLFLCHILLCIRLFYSYLNYDLYLIHVPVLSDVVLLKEQWERDPYCIVALPITCLLVSLDSYLTSFNK